MFSYVNRKNECIENSLCKTESLKKMIRFNVHQTNALDLLTYLILQSEYDTKEIGLNNKIEPPSAFFSIFLYLNSCRFYL